MALNISKPFPVIAAVDPAIETEAMTETEMLAYIHERDVSTLKIKQGMKAAAFMLREITHEHQQEILETCTTDSARFVKAFRFAVIEARLANGDKMAPINEKQGFTADEAKAFRMSTIVDIGSVAWARSFLGPEIARRFAPQPLLLAHLAALPYRSAEPSAADPSKSKGSDTPASAGHAELESGDSSASPTVAPATAETSHPAA